MTSFPIIVRDGYYVSQIHCGQHIIEVKNLIVPQFFTVIALQPVIHICSKCGKVLCLHWTKDGLRVFE